MNPRAIGWGQLALVAGGVGAAAWLVMSQVTRHGGTLPILPWWGLPVFAFLVAVLLGSGWDIRRYLRGRHPRCPSPQRARYTLAGAQSAAVTGALLLGWYGASAVVAWTLADVPSVRDAAYRNLAHAIAAAVLAVAGMLTQTWCVLPPRDGSESDDESDGAAPA